MHGLSTGIQLNKRRTFHSVAAQKNSDFTIKETCKSSSCLSPVCYELLFFVSSVLQAVAAVGSVKTGSGQAGTFAGPAALAGEQAVSHAPVAAAVGPKAMSTEGEHRGAHHGKTERRKT